MTSAIVLGIVLYGGICILVFVGWSRWSRDPNRKTSLSDLSLASFAVGNASVLLAAGSALYAQAIGGFFHLDPRLLSIYISGLLLSLVGVVLGLLGKIHSGPLRLVAPILSGWMLVLWIMWAGSE